MGNANHNTSWSVKVPSHGTYYWSVQALDAAFVGSFFANEVQFQTCVSFADVGAALDSLDASAAAWGDYDNDGDPDLLMCGSNTAGRVTHLYRNTSGAFVEVSTNFPDQDGDASWGDYDNDGDLDLLMSGCDGTG